MEWWQRLNTNPNAKTILCYGDSNTHGSKPDRNGRFAANERWTGILQQNLGDDYYIIEEGLGGRTTDLEHYNPGKPSRNGLTYFKACLDSHKLLDFIIIMLGTNDLKTVYNRTAENIALALKQYPDYVKSFCQSLNLRLPTIILISPPIMDEHAPKFVEGMPEPGIYDEVSAKKSRHLPEAIKPIAEQTNCVFFDAATVAHPGEDGCHLDLASHTALGEALTKLIVSDL